MSRAAVPEGAQCRCRHGLVMHRAAMDGECIAPGCGCKAYRDRHAVEMRLPDQERHATPHLSRALHTSPPFAPTQEDLRVDLPTGDRGWREAATLDPQTLARLETALRRALVALGNLAVAVGDAQEQFALLQQSPDA